MLKKDIHSGKAKIGTQYEPMKVIIIFLFPVYFFSISKILFQAAVIEPSSAHHVIIAISWWLQSTSQNNEGTGNRVFLHLFFSFVVCSYKAHFSARQRQIWFSSTIATWLNSKKIKQIHMDCKNYLHSWFLKNTIENSANFGLTVIAKFLQKSVCGFLEVFIWFFFQIE